MAFETMHTMTNLLKGREGHMALKLGMSKAYDRLDWSFLVVVMTKLGFVKKWVDIIMRCVTLVSYSILINGIPQNPFLPSRGIRQRDHLSPYWFILCVEVLTKLIQKAESRGAITGFPIGRSGLHMSHLFFTDDCLLFCKANPLEWSRLLFSLETYEQGSGQRLNEDKTFIFFSKNVRNEAKDLNIVVAGIKSSQSYNKYLGLPAQIGRDVIKGFKSIID
ncbi:uncharacterized protein LOC121255147 [Juglans microcarpa x Juglans regia]|uniref:uncharacterized protein LOC121255147 n=1 Tax=Juglans microcarpa x Juglans regia TaxID=2249226 RepID=UPI001B7F09B3|nr:uncharacterized protein LOC121255147 [Juglans microcarpa x Juglans regia]